MTAQDLRTRAEAARKRARHQRTGCPDDDAAYAARIEEIADILDSRADALEANNQTEGGE